MRKLSFLLFLPCVAHLHAQTDWRRGAADEEPRIDHAMVYDLARRTMVLFGGRRDLQTIAHTRLWNGTSWSDPVLPVEPAARSNHAMAYDVLRSRVVLFGGAGVAGRLSDTWEFDGTTWLQRAPAHSPPARSETAMAHDWLRGRVVLFGGRQSTGAPVLLAVGLSDATFGGASLPASLGGLGLDGCTLFTSLDLLWLTFAAGARAEFALPVPTTASLAGVPFFAQAAIADAAANAAGIVVSDALAGRIGAM